MKKLIKQGLKFCVVGVICTIIDFGTLILLREVFGVNYLVANIAAFTVSVIVNYILSMRYVFQGKKNTSKVREFIIFVVLSAIGLGLNEFLMWVSVTNFGLNYIVGKVIATAIVMVYNFFSKKICLEEKQCDS